MNRILFIFLEISLILSIVSCASINANLKKNTSRGLGVTRASFGPLNPQRLEPGFSACNQNIGLGIDETLRKGLSTLIDPLRNTTGKPDVTLDKDELTPYFSFITIMGQPVIRIIDRTDNSIDFWFLGDAVREAHHADQAAQDFCKSRDSISAKYIGFSYRCGNSTATPVNINGQVVAFKEEERIVAYDCIKNGNSRQDEVKNLPKSTSSVP